MSKPVQDSVHSIKDPFGDEQAKQHLHQAQDLLDDLNDEEQKGFSLGGEQQFQALEKPQKQEIEDEYDDDFDEEIQEDLPDPVENSTEIVGKSGDTANGSRGLNSSGGGIGVSQSLGVDPSVDSLALDEYDHVEPVERV